MVRKSSSSVRRRKYQQPAEHEDSRFKLKKIIATIIVVFLIGFVLYALRSFINAFLGAFIVYFLTRPIYNHFVKKRHWHRGLVAGLLLVFTFLVIIVPLSFGASLLVKEATTLASNSDVFVEKIRGIDSWFPSADLTSLIDEQLQTMGSFLKDVALSTINNIGGFLINLVIFFFSLFYLYLDAPRVAKRIGKYVPFNKENAKKISQRFKEITYSTVLATGLIGVAQGILIALSFWVLGLNAPVLWGFVAMIFAMLPVVGIPMVWLPAVLILAFVDGRIGAAIGLAIWGLIITNVDYVWWRPWIQRRAGRIHPLITLVGIFMGLPIFGILGLILGPLLLSIVVSMTQMYVEEFLVE